MEFIPKCFRNNISIIKLRMFSYNILYRDSNSVINFCICWAYFRVPEGVSFLKYENVTLFYNSCLIEIICLFLYTLIWSNMLCINWIFPWSYTTKSFECWVTSTRLAQSLIHVFGPHLYAHTKFIWNYFIPYYEFGLDCVNYVVYIICVWIV